MTTGVVFLSDIDSTLSDSVFTRGVIWDIDSFGE